MKMFLVVFLIISLKGASFALDRSEIHKVLRKKNTNNNTYQSDGKIRRESKSYLLDINNDNKKETIKIVFEDAHYVFNIYSNQYKLLHSQKIRVKNLDSGIDRFFVEDLGEGLFTIVIFLREGVYRTDETLLTRRIDLLTFEPKPLKDFFYFKGPVVTVYKKDWQEHIFELKSNVYFSDKGPYKRKSLIIKDLTSSRTLKWNEIKKTWY